MAREHYVGRLELLYDIGMFRSLNFLFPSFSSFVPQSFRIMRRGGQREEVLPFYTLLFKTRRENVYMNQECSGR